MKYTLGEIQQWCLMCGYCCALGVDVDIETHLGDLKGIFEQLKAQNIGLA